MVLLFAFIGFALLGLLLFFKKEAPVDPDAHANEARGGDPPEGKGERRPLSRLALKHGAKLSLPPRRLSYACFGIALILIGYASCFVVPDYHLGHVKRIYFGATMPEGRVIAGPNEKGPQAETYRPGFHFVILIRVHSVIEDRPNKRIDDGKYGFLVAKDGRPMPAGQFIADEWTTADKLVDAMYFMGYDSENGGKGPRGIKGPQLTVIPPGSWPYNHYLFDIQLDSVTHVAPGTVGVVKSNVGKEYTGRPVVPEHVDASTLSVPIVPRGHIGVWADVFFPGAYYINKKAYEIHAVDTRVHNFEYIGGYTRRWIDLEVDRDGNIVQKLRPERIDVPKDAADEALLLRVEDWEVFLDARLQVQISPDNAPYVFSSVGGLSDLEDKIITPNFRSLARNIVSKPITVTEPVLLPSGDPRKDSAGNVLMQTVYRPRKVLDLLYQREELEKAVTEALIPECAKVGLTLFSVRFGDPAVPPELLIPGKRRQLANSLMETYKQEKLAQTERVATESERAKADQQGKLMESQIGIQIADNTAAARQKAGAGERAFLEAVAKGQEAQAGVLGKDRAFELAYAKEILTIAAKHPEIIKVPTTLVTGGGKDSLTGAAAILGASNLGGAIVHPKADSAKP